MEKKIIQLGPIEANCVVLWNDPSAAVVVDPGADAEVLLNFLDAKNLVPAAVFLTHGHFDHIGALPELMKRWPDLPIHIGADDVRMIGHPMNCWEPEYPLIEKPTTLVPDLSDGAAFSVGGIEFTVIATPGHTPGGVCLYFGKEKLLLSGDTLFAGSCGRTDFPGGNMGTLMGSLANLASLPADVEVICGHGMNTTIAREKASNPFLNK